MLHRRHSPPFIRLSMPVVLRHCSHPLLRYLQVPACAMLLWLHRSNAGDEVSCTRYQGGIRYVSRLWYVVPGTRRGHTFTK
uniref:Uncharacterized protein n=1 Tax=Oryza glumipatula TaxID=40148 RepID=A0A0D9YFY2_9ORYZ